jgi:surface polysaccharide O-acyltransferase-like enzyme
MENTKRFDEISIMRVLAMTMIIALHSLCFYSGRWTYMGAIDVPFWSSVANFLNEIDLNMFVFISGYLYGYLYIFRNKYRHPTEVIRNKVLRLLLPYCLWGVFMVVVFPFYSLPQILYGVSHVWFLLMLFWVFTMTVVLQLLNAQRLKFTRGLGLTLIVVGYVFGAVFVKFVNPDDFLCLSRSSYYFVAFMVGYLCAKLQVGWMMPGSSFLVLPVAVAVLILLIHYRLFLPYSVGRLMMSICSYAICVSLLIILSKTTISTGTRRYIQLVERLSMGIYIFNQIAMASVFSIPVLHEWFEMHWIVGPFILFLIGFFPPMLLSYIFNRNKHLSWMIGS